MLAQHLGSPATLSRDLRLLRRPNTPNCLQQQLTTEATRGAIAVQGKTFKLGGDSLQSVTHDPEKGKEDWKEGKTSS